MAISIKYEADLTAVRKAIDDLVAEQGRRTVNIPVSTAGFAPGAPGTTGGIPTASGVFAGSRDMVAGRFGGIDRFTIPGFAAPFAPLGGFPGVLGDSFAFQGVNPAYAAIRASAGNVTAGSAAGRATDVLAGVPAEIAAARAAALAAPGAAASKFATTAGAAVMAEEGPARLSADQAWLALGGDRNRPAAATGGGYGRGRTRLPFGIGGILGIGALASAVAHGLDAERQYAIDTALAAGQPGEELQATLEYRQRLVHGTGFIGRAVAYLQDPSGNAELGIRSTLSSSEIQDQRDTRRQQRFDYRRRLEDASSVLAAGPDSYSRTLRRIENEREARGREITAQDRLAGQDDARARYAESARLQSTFDDRVAARFRAAYPRQLQNEQEAGYNAINQTVAREDQEYMARYRRDLSNARQNVTNEQRQVSNRLYFEETVEAHRVEGFRRSDVLIRARGEIAESNARISNDPAGAMLARVRAANNAALNAALARNAPEAEMRQIAAAAQANEDAARSEIARQQRSEVAGAVTGINATAQILARNPQAATETQIRGRFAERRSQLPNNAWGFALATLSHAEEELTVGVARQRDQDERNYRRQELQGQATQYGLEIQDRPLAGAAGRRRDEALLRSRILREQNNDPQNAANVLQVAILEQQAEERRVLRQARAVQIGINETDFSGTPRGGEEEQKYLSSIDKNIETLTNAITRGGVPATTVP